MNEIDYTLIDKAIANPDFFSTLILLFVFIFIFMVIILPIIYNSNRRSDNIMNTFQKHSDEDNVNFKELNKTLIKMSLLSQLHNDDAKDQFTFLRNNLNNTTLHDEQAVRLFKAEMWLTSRKKLNFIKDILLNNHIEGREEFIIEKVTL